MITIITATFNAEKTIRTCLASILQQSLPPACHIVIDGKSDDDTVNIIKSISKDSLIITEPDNGIYDAMNKGVRLAESEVVGILNADDFYASPYVLEKVTEVFQDPSIEVCYGDLLYVDCKDTTEKVIRYWKSGDYSPRKFYWGWMPPHPTFFVRKSAYERFGLFNLDLGSAADYELMLRFLVRHCLHAKYIPDVLVKMRTGGISNASLHNRLNANRMDRLAWSINGLHPYPWTIALKPLRKVGQWVFTKPREPQ